MNSDVIDESLRADIPLADLIHALRRELELALERSAGQRITFDTEKVELELQVVVSKKTVTEGGIDFYVKAGHNRESSNERTHTFKLTLLPIDARTGGRLHVRDETTTPPSGLPKR